MTGFAPLDFVVAMVSPSITESIIASWDSPVYELAEKAKDKGIRGINKFLQSSGGKDKRYGYRTTEINQEILNKLLKGELKTLEELTIEIQSNTLNSDYESFNYVLFHYEKDDTSIEKPVTIIDSIFIKN
jgi:hypothetical protein